MTALCEPAVEICSEGAALLRPGPGDLVQMNLTYYLNILLVPISIWLLALLRLLAQ